MLSKSKFGLIAAMVVCAVSAPTSVVRANTATVSPGGAVTGTTGAVQFTFNTARKTLSCTSMRFTATLATSTSGSLPLTITAGLAPSYSGCTVTGGVGVAGPCSVSALSLTGLTSGGITPFTITNFSCTPGVGGGTTCTVRFTNTTGSSGGSLTGHFDNSGSRATVISPSGQNLAATGSTNGSGGMCALLPNDSSVTFGTSGGGNAVFAVSPSQTITVV